jgi:chemotaxis protein MotA
MDILSLIGVILAFGAIIGGNWIEGGHLGSLLNGPALMIVLGGSLGAVLLQTPLPVFMRSLRMVGGVFMPPKRPLAPTIKNMVEWSQRARKEGLLGLEDVMEKEVDPFVRKGLQLLVDGSEPETIRQVLEVELENREHLDLQAAKMYEAMGGYTPTVGIIGAVMGLIHVMQNLADPEKLGGGIATAFVATIYGVGAANLFLLPLANKLKSLVRRDTQYRALVIEGIVAIAEGENPRNIEAKLQGFLH